MPTVSVTKQYAIEPEKMWTLISKADNMDKYLPDMVSQCTLISAEEGGKRVCTTAQGQIHETVLLNDRDQMIFKYSIDNEDAPMPVSNYVGTASVTPLGTTNTEVTWSAEFDAKGMPEEEVVGMLEGVFGALVDNIYQTAAA